MPRRRIGARPVGWEPKIFHGVTGRYEGAHADTGSCRECAFRTDKEATMAAAHCNASYVSFGLPALTLFVPHFRVVGRAVITGDRMLCPVLNTMIRVERVNTKSPEHLYVIFHVVN